MSGLEEKREFIEKMKDLLETRILIMKTDFALAKKEREENLSEEKKGIASKYEKETAELTEAYDSRLKELIKEKQKLEKKEETIMINHKNSIIESRKVKFETEKTIKTLKSEIIENTKKGNTKEAQEALKKLQKLEEKNPMAKQEAKNEKLKEEKEALRKQIHDIEKEYEDTLKARKIDFQRIKAGKFKELFETDKRNFLESDVGKVAKNIVENAPQAIAEQVENISGKAKIAQKVIAEQIQNVSEKAKKAPSAIEEHMDKISQNETPLVNSLANERKRRIEERAEANPEGATEVREEESIDISEKMKELLEKGQELGKVAIEKGGNMAKKAGKAAIEKGGNAAKKAGKVATEMSGIAAQKLGEVGKAAIEKGGNTAKRVGKAATEIGGNAVKKVMETEAGEKASQLMKSGKESIRDIIERGRQANQLLLQYANRIFENTQEKVEDKEQEHTTEENEK